MTLTVHDLTKSYGATPVLHGVDLAVPRGSFTAVLGPSGCGKTTLLRCVAGFEAVSGGAIEIDGRDVTGLPPERRSVGIVPQEGALFPHLTVARNVGFGLRRALRGRVAELLDLAGLAGFGDRMPHELSGGQQQRVALARALAPGPGVVLLDEPFNALDRSLRVSVREDVRQALSQAGATALLVTHDQEEALSIADRVAVMRAGRIVQAGPPAEVYGRPADLEVATFVGEALVLDGSCDGDVVSCVLGRLPARLSSGHSRGRGRVVLRPEQLVLDGAGIPARVERVEFFGHDASVTLALSGSPAPVHARVQGTALPRPGDEVRVSVQGTALFYS